MNLWLLKIRHAVSIDTHSYFSAPLVARLNKLLNYVNMVTSCYALFKLPHTGFQWRSDAMGPNKDAAFLYVNGKRVKVWIVGEIEALWFEDNDGQNNRWVSIGLQPLLEADYMRACNLQCHQSQPVDGAL